ncbi:MAG: hypothetical protein ABIF10_02505 [Candidatus Woesearchaeota archaeon]
MRKWLTFGAVGLMISASACAHRPTIENVINDYNVVCVSNYYKGGADHFCDIREGGVSKATLKAGYYKRGEGFYSYLTPENDESEGLQQVINKVLCIIMPHECRKQGSKQNTTYP